MRTQLSVLGAIVVAFLLVLSCDPQTNDADIQATPGHAAVMLPPGHPGVMNGFTLILPPEPTPPLVHAANCFAGVEFDRQIGVGSVGGVTLHYLGHAVLPVNLNLAAANLGRYRIKLTISDPTLVAFDPANVLGSIPILANGSCLNRGCPPGCGEYPTYYPDQFDPAPGFTQVPLVTSGVGWVRVEANNADPVNPTSGVVNLCNLPIDVIGELPAGGVVITFQVELLENTAAAAIAPSAIFHGVVADAVQIQ